MIYICSQKDRQCTLPVLPIRQWPHSNSCTWGHDVQFLVLIKETIFLSFSIRMPYLSSNISSKICYSSFGAEILWIARTKALNTSSKLLNGSCTCKTCHV